ncbi:efflux RND transporter periplasmic adaptor subunit [Persicimonas caeni]|uniref:Efflux RND transporter periplasmic adaptor subunit n=1 Tax=Persicimonas caeni TaxID=2292766 RepID=A0A4Y6PMP1_PERCE|nr:efflux RND transporter periplasmic adaptor subunit [Persicimonas caeni]QDG49489.1 efflux RND transporter periplasmic adaptor subunit [Persicimonas caeni]QED30710.1 efflux RND transporter periplasmic adaptor subunit [Persicimonas caeni]
MQIRTNQFVAVCAALLIALALAGCEDDHGHEHGDEAGHGHGDEHGHGDDHGHEDEHGHGHGESDRPTHVVTLFGEHTELFVEFPAFVAGHGSEFAAHFTTLDDYQPVREGKLSVVLTSEGSPGERWEATEPARPGIFTPTATPKYVGERKLLLVLQTDEFTERFDLGELQVFDAKEAAREVDIDNPEGDISFLKEQQWKVDFNVAPVARRKMRPSVPVNATIRPSADGEAVVTAPFDGRLGAPKEGIPQVGQPVEAGQIVAYVVPSLGAGEISQLRSELRKAKVELGRAERELARISGLVDSGALPQKRLTDAESAKALAKAEVEQAQQRLRQYRNLESRGGGANGRIAIRSPIDGTIAQRNVVDGGFVSSGDELLRVVDRSQLWLEAHVPEADLPRISAPTGAWFEPADDQAPVEVDIDDGGELVSFGEVIDPQTRTAPLIFALAEADARPNLRIGSFVRAHIFSGKPKEVVAIPSSAVLDEKGLDVVYVMVGGESFERRTVRLGIHDRGRVEVLDGLAPGEHVVSQGAYYVKLASTATGAVGHGHTH